MKTRSFAPYLTMKFWNGLLAIASILAFGLLRSQSERFRSLTLGPLERGLRRFETDVLIGVVVGDRAQGLVDSGVRERRERGDGFAARRGIVVAAGPPGQPRRRARGAREGPSLRSWRGLCLKEDRADPEVGARVLQERLKDGDQSRRLPVGISRTRSSAASTSTGFSLCRSSGRLAQRYASLLRS